MSKTEGGFYEQIQGVMNPVLVEHYYSQRIEKTNDSFDYLVKIMKAHVCMLAEQSIIPLEAARKLLVAMNDLDSETIYLDPSLEDLYINFESNIISTLGKEIGGYLPVARSRNDVEAAMWRIELREKLFQLADSVLDVVSALHERAEETSSYVCPGYTYDQQAQPITMGHYLLGIVQPLIRNTERIIECVGRFNKNPLGAVAFAGTRINIDMELTAELLGFDGVMENTQDAIAGCDYMLESANTAVINLNTLSRLAEDIIKWCSNELGFADLPNDLIDSSTIMPQKRNPVICATVRSQARLVAGIYAGICASCSVKNEASRDVTIAFDEVIDCIRISNSMTRISEAYVETLIFNKEAMEDMLQKGFSNATEIADSLVIEGKIPFRMAHSIVGGAIAELYEKGLGQSDLNHEILDKWSHKVIDKELPLTKEEVEQAKDFHVCVERKNSSGSTSQKEIAKALERQKSQVEQLILNMEKERNKWNDANKKLDDKILTIIN